MSHQTSLDIATLTINRLNEFHNQCVANADFRFERLCNLFRKDDWPDVKVFFTDLLWGQTALGDLQMLGIYFQGKSKRREVSVRKPINAHETSAWAQKVDRVRLNSRSTHADVLAENEGPAQRATPGVSTVSSQCTMECSKCGWYKKERKVLMQTIRRLRR